jgi:hypothetical protein
MQTGAARKIRQVLWAPVWLVTGGPAPRFPNPPVRLQRRQGAVLSLPHDRATDSPDAQGDVSDRVVHDALPEEGGREELKRSTLVALSGLVRLVSPVIGLVLALPRTSQVKARLAKQSPALARRRVFDERPHGRPYAI